MHHNLFSVLIRFRDLDLDICGYDTIPMPVFLNIIIIVIILVVVGIILLLFIINITESNSAILMCHFTYLLVVVFSFIVFIVHRIVTWHKNFLRDK